jgi:hypothetical protein
MIVAGGLAQAMLGSAGPKCGSGAVALIVAL